jgi:DNA polymerase-3 subunit beta
MKFIVSSTELLSHLQSISRVISSKNTMPILDNFLFELTEDELKITASDLESTMITVLKPENIDGEGKIALEAKRMLDILKEFPEQPLTFEIDGETLSCDILSENGKFSVIGMPGDEFPLVPELKKAEKVSFRLSPEILTKGINKTLFAAANDELRPVMNGIYFAITENDLTFVASDSHKLVRYRRTDAKSDKSSSFILPKKPANLLKSILGKALDEILVEFDDKNAVFTIAQYKLINRLTEGQFPNYESVIPVENPNKLIVDRQNFFNSLKRVSVFSNQASNLVKLQLTGNMMTVSAQDIDFSISAYERLDCQYEGEEMEIGFKSLFLTEILSNMSSKDVVFELSDPSRAGIMVPFAKDTEDEDELMLLMPMMIN